MKKVFLAAIIAFGFASCSNDDDSIPENTTSQYANVTAKLASFDANKSLTGKPVQRGTIPTTINTITVTVDHSNIAVLDQTTIFNLVADGTADAATAFNIEKVTSGINMFKAVALTTASPSMTVGMTTGYTKEQTTALLTTQQAMVPYVKYTADVSKSIVLGSPQEVAFNMATANGRIISSVETAPTLTAMGRKVTVTGQRFLSGTIGSQSADRSTPVTITNAVPLVASNGGSTDTVGAVIPSLTTPAGTQVNITGTVNSWGYWSNENSVTGGFIYLKTDIYGPNGAGVDGILGGANAADDVISTTIEKSYYSIISVVANRGIVARETISFDGITEDINYATFTFPAWTNDAVN
jgi:hypothetical protein